MAVWLRFKFRTYQCYETVGKNGREPDLDTLIYIANRCCVSVDWLLGVDDDPRHSFYFKKELKSFQNHPNTTEKDIENLLAVLEVNPKNIFTKILILNQFKDMRDNLDYSQGDGT